MHPYPIPDSSWIPIAENYDISLQEDNATPSPTPTASPLNAEESWVKIQNINITSKNQNDTIDADVEVEYSLVKESSGILQVMYNYDKEDRYRDIGDESSIVIHAGRGHHTFHVHIKLPPWECKINAYIHPNPLPEGSWNSIAHSTPVSLSDVSKEA